MKPLLYTFLVFFASQSLALDIGDPQSVALRFNSPAPETTIARSSKFFVYVVGEGTFTDLDVSAIFESGEVRQLDFETIRCGKYERCSLMLDPGLLPANIDFRLVVTGAGETQEFRFSTNEVIDIEAPRVRELVLETLGVQKSSQEYSDSFVLQRIVTLNAFDASDNIGVIAYDLIGGISSNLLEKSSGPQVPAQFYDSINENDAFGTQCYRLRAWDASGNQGFSEPECFDVTISEEERSSFGCVCYATNSQSQAGLCFALIALVLLCRGPRANCEARRLGE